MKSYLLHLMVLILVFPLSSIAISQPVSSQQFPNYGIFQYFVPSENSLQNSNSLPYWENSQFRPGKIITKSNQKIIPNGIRYNIAEDVMECQIKTQHCRISSPRKISKVEINGNSFEYKKYISKGDSVKGYLMNIYRASKCIYAKLTIANTHSKDSRLAVNSTYYLEENSNLPHKIQSIRSVIGKIFPGKQSLATKFMNAHSYQWNNPSQVANLIHYLSNFQEDKVATR